MSPSQERKFLKVVLLRIDNGPAPLFASRWSTLGIWFGLVALSVIAFSIARLVNHYVAAAMFVFLGVGYAHLSFRVAAAKGWPILRRYLDREAIAARLGELGA